MKTDKKVFGEYTVLCTRYGVCMVFALLTAMPMTSAFAAKQGVVFPMAKSLYSQYGVQVHYDYDRLKYFPQSWQVPPISARGDQVDKEEVERLLSVTEQFLAAYPQQVLNDNLKNIYFLKELYFYDKSFGATNSRTGLYIKNQGVKRGFTDTFLLSTLHSEFSSILLRNQRPLFPEKEWHALNDQNFKYRGTGREMLGEKGLYSQSPELLEQGFIVKYAQSSLENDLNMIVYWLFSHREKLRDLEEKYARIHEKVELAILFYESISTEFDLR